MRSLSPALIALIKERKVVPSVFVYADFPSGPVRLWSGVGNIFILDATWEGAGQMMSISSISETSEAGGNQGISVSVRGIDSTIASKLQNENFQFREAYILLAFKTPSNTYEFMNDPLWKGYMDVDRGSSSSKERSLTIRGEHRLMDILRKREWKYTHADQLALHPGTVDTGLSHMESIQDASIPWGRTQK